MYERFSLVFLLDVTKITLANFKDGIKKYNYIYIAIKVRTGATKECSSSEQWEACNVSSVRLESEY